MHRPLTAFAVLIACGLPIAVVCALLPVVERPIPAAAAENQPNAKPAPSARRAAIGRAHAGDADAHFKLPKWWKAGDPVPHRQVKLRPLSPNGGP